MSVSDGLAGLTIRRATPDDDKQVLQLMRDTHGWRPDEPNDALFRWKHRENPFGESPAWVALDGDQVVGYRTFMRWEFLDSEDRVLTAARAVDTATAEGYRGRGIFRALTLQAVGELTIEGVGIVFNTPNDQSRPGYLKMGWTSVGRIPIGVMPAGPRGLRKMFTARVPAERWSVPTGLGIKASQAFNGPSIAAGLLTLAPRDRLQTRRSAEYLAWRTAPEGLHYRLLLADSSDPAQGGLVFRLRRRGEALEAVILESFVEGGLTLLALVRDLLRETDADYALATRNGPVPALVPLPNRGPTLTTRPLAVTPPSSGWHLAMADIELM